MIDSFAPIDPKLVDVTLPDHDGYPDELAAGDTPDVLWDVCGSASRRMPDALRIPQSQWRAVAAENDRLKTWPMNYIDRYTNQVPTHECTNHSHTRAMEGCRNRQRSISFADGPKKEFRYPDSAEFNSVWFSAMFPYNFANPRIRGGAAIRTILEYSCQYGMMPDHKQPKDYGFKHTMPGTMGGGNLNQSRGDWVSKANMPDGWQETAKHFKALEIIFPESWEDAVSLVLNGLFVCVGRNGHAIPWGQWLPDRQVMAYPDSYNVTRYDSLRTVQSAWRGSYAVATVVTPDDWSKPAG